MKQRQALMNIFTTLYTAKTGLTWTNERGMTKDDVDYTEAKRQLLAGFSAGEIDLSPEFDRAKLNSYIPSLVNDFLRKDVRINGGVKYENKAPNSRVGANDAQVKALKALAIQLGKDHAEYNTVVAALDKRIAELKPKNQVTIDINLVPAELRHLITDSEE